MPPPDRYGLVGQPVGHSLSPRIHAMFAAQTRQALTYEAYEVAPARLHETVRAFFGSGGAGLNVTVPHKQAVIGLLDSLSERAQRAGAVNTLLRDDRGLHGDNTDGIGLVRDLTVRLGLAVMAQRVLLLGAGGAARGVLAPLLALDPAVLVIANRDAARAQELAAAFSTGKAVRGLGLAALDTLEGPFDLILNATAASLSGQTPALPSRLVGPRTVCYDLAYGAQETAFVRWARIAGAAAAHDGLGMLVEQAAESFRLWRGLQPQTAPVLEALRVQREAPATPSP